MTYLGCPIVGDKKYYIQKKRNSKHLLLHAYKIKFILNNIKYSFKADLPEYFDSFLVKNNLKQKDF